MKYFKVISEAAKFAVRRSTYITNYPDHILSAAYALRREGKHSRAKIVSEISSKLGRRTSIQTANRILDSDENKKRPDYHPHIIPPQMPYRYKLSDDQFIKLYDMRRQGKSDFQISKATKIYPAMLTKHLEDNAERFPNDYHPQVYSKPPNANELKDKVKELHFDHGHNYDKIGSMLGISRGKVAGIINRMRKAGNVPAAKKIKKDNSPIFGRKPDQASNIPAATSPVDNIRGETPGKHIPAKYRGVFQRFNDILARQKARNRE